MHRRWENDMLRLREMGIDVLEGDLLQRGVKVRHNPAATATVAMELARRGRRRAPSNYRATLRN